MPFAEVKRLFIVEHFLASRSYLTCRNEFRDTFTYSSASNKWTVSRLAHRFGDKRVLQRVTSNMRDRVNACIAGRGGHFQLLNITLIFVLISLLFIF
jgi:hypothetical protein